MYSIVTEGKDGKMVYFEAYKYIVSNGNIYQGFKGTLLNYIMNF